MQQNLFSTSNTSTSCFVPLMLSKPDFGVRYFVLFTSKLERTFVNRGENICIIWRTPIQKKLNMKESNCSIRKVSIRIEYLRVKYWIDFYHFLLLSNIYFTMIFSTDLLTVDIYFKETLVSLWSTKLERKIGLVMISLDMTGLGEIVRDMSGFLLAIWLWWCMLLTFEIHL